MAIPANEFAVMRITQVLRSAGWEQTGADLRGPTILVTAQRGRGEATPEQARAWISSLSLSVRTLGWDIVTSDLRPPQVQVTIERDKVSK